MCMLQRRPNNNQLSFSPKLREMPENRSGYINSWMGDYLNVSNGFAAHACSSKHFPAEVYQMM